MSKKRSFLIFIFIALLLVTCNKKVEQKEETIIKGTTSVLVDETLTPVIEDQVAVFESYYDAKINLDSQSEVEILKSLFNKKTGIAILTRKLSSQELKIFEQKKIKPRITPFASDAIAFIRNKNNNDTLIALKDVIDFMKGMPNLSIKGLVFDNPNSSTVRFMNDLSAIKVSAQKGIYSFKTNEEVIKFVAQNDGMVGVVGVNWLSQPSPKMQEYVDKVNVLGVKGITSTHFYTPSQNNIAEGKYPLAAPSPTHWNSPRRKPSRRSLQPWWRYLDEGSRPSARLGFCNVPPVSG